MRCPGPGRRGGPQDPDGSAGACGRAARRGAAASGGWATAGLEAAEATAQAWGASAGGGAGRAHRGGCEQQHQAAGGGPLPQPVGDDTRQDPACNAGCRGRTEVLASGKAPQGGRDCSYSSETGTSLPRPFPVPVGRQPPPPCLTDLCGCGHPRVPRGHLPVSQRGASQSRAVGRPQSPVTCQGANTASPSVLRARAPCLTERQTAVGQGPGRGRATATQGRAALGDTSQRRRPPRVCPGQWTGRGGTHRRSRPRRTRWTAPRPS